MITEIALLVRKKARRAVHDVGSKDGSEPFSRLAHAICLPHARAHLNV